MFWRAQRSIAALGFNESIASTSTVGRGPVADQNVHAALPRAVDDVGVLAQAGVLQVQVGVHELGVFRFHPCHCIDGRDAVQATGSGEIKPQSNQDLLPWVSLWECIFDGCETVGVLRAYDMINGLQSTDMAP